MTNDKWKQEHQLEHQDNLIHRANYTKVRLYKSNEKVEEKKWHDFPYAMPPETEDALCQKMNESHDETAENGDRRGPTSPVRRPV